MSGLSTRRLKPQVMTAHRLGLAGFDVKLVASVALMPTGVIDLFSRRVVGWSMQNRQPTDLVLQVLLMAVWRRKPTSTVQVHSDQGSQSTSIDWTSFLEHHNLDHSMSRHGNCHDNAVAESFFNLLKRERIRRRTYKLSEDAIDYIEMFHNPKRKYVRNSMLSPADFERQRQPKL